MVCRLLCSHEAGGNHHRGRIGIVHWKWGANKHHIYYKVNYSWESLECLAWSVVLVWQTKPVEVLGISLMWVCEWVFLVDTRILRLVVH